MLVILLFVLIVSIGIALYFTVHSKENYGLTLGPWGYHYIPNEFVYPNYEYTYEDGQYAYFFDEVGDMWKARLPITGPPHLERA